MQTNILIFKALLFRDMKVLQKTIFKDFIDTIILVSLQYVNFVYFLPRMGMSAALIVPLFAGSVGSVFINTAYDRAITDSADIAFTRFIKYQMTLPISLTWLFVQKIIVHMVNIALYSGPVLGVLLWYARTHITPLGVLFFCVVYFLALIFISALIIAMAYGTHFFWFIDNVWTRVLMPFLMLGCIFFPWKSVYALNKWVGVLYALSPITYIVEGLRSALLGTHEFIPAPLCVGVLFLLTILMVLIARRIFSWRLYA